MDIFSNNFKFIFIYSIPYLGVAYYFVTFCYSGILFNLYFDNNGFEIAKLVHVPFEIFAFSIPVSISLFKVKRNRIILLLIAIVLILLSSIIESRFS